MLIFRQIKCQAHLEMSFFGLVALGRIEYELFMKLYFAFISPEPRKNNATSHYILLKHKSKGIFCKVISL